MATIICMDGLGGHPQTTFGRLKTYLEQSNHKVVLLPIEGIETHEDRISRILTEYYRQDNPKYTFLLGQSAGGGAARVVAATLDYSNLPLGGVILLSQSMPLGVSYLTLSLAKRIIWRLPSLLLGKTIETTSDEYLDLVNPLSPELFEQSWFADIVSTRQDFPGKEARELAFWPRKFREYSFPTLAIYGDHDQWVSPGGHRKVCRKLERSSKVTKFEVEGSGHLTLASNRRMEVMEKIRTWIEAQ
jgi:pimeloyl-ACP methyl ester carboxylesterase